MTSTVRILLPVFLESEIYFKGYVIISEEHAITIYITKYGPEGKIPLENQQKWDNTIYGYCGDNVSKRKLSGLYNFLILDLNGISITVNKLVVNGTQLSVKNNCIIMLYDYHSIKASQTITDSLDYFSKLQHLIKHDNGERTSTSDFISNFKIPSWLSSSMFLQHICNYWHLIHWFVLTIRRDKKISVKHGNFMLAIITDIVLGYIVLQLFSQDKKDISTHLMGILEKLINLLYSLLKWLMGAPVGLKLNNAFNKMLGRYFSYHVQLWWLFLDVSGEKLDIILHIYNYIGYLGFTFQTAVIADMICLATFHSYCIYVYAARLFNIQISGLIALLRLFVGRKYNPLRGGIDSCEYTNQELFVGTVAFTILLLLLPTTALYYIVFTLFRILSITVQYCLAKLIYVLQVLPLYVVSLWLTRSPKVAGNILLEVVSKEDNSPLVVRVKLFSKSIQELVKTFRPPVEVPRPVEWTNLLSNVLVGKQIV